MKKQKTISPDEIDKIKLLIKSYSSQVSKTNLNDLMLFYSGQDYQLTIPRFYLELCDNNHTTALFLSQLMYWNNKSKNIGWIYKSNKDWFDELALSRRNIDNAVTFLKSKNWIETKLKKANGSPTTHYRITSKFMNDVVTFLENKYDVNCNKEQIDLSDVTNAIVQTVQNYNIDYNIDYIQKEEKRKEEPEQEQEQYSSHNTLQHGTCNTVYQPVNISKEEYDNLLNLTIESFFNLNQLEEKDKTKEKESLIFEKLEVFEYIFHLHQISSSFFNKENKKEITKLYNLINSHFFQIYKKKDKFKFYEEYILENNLPHIISPFSKLSGNVNGQMPQIKFCTLQTREAI